MTKLSIELRQEEPICVEVVCSDCGRQFSTELDLNFKFNEISFQNVGIIHCIYCEEPYEYILKYDSNILEVNFFREEFFGGLKISKATSFKEDEEKITPEQSKKYYFLEIDRLQKIIQLKPKNVALEQALHRLVFSGVITTLETYLGEVFAQIVFHSQYTLETFVQEYVPYQKEKVALNNLFKLSNSIELRVKDDLNNFIYHNIPKLINLFKIYDFDLREFEDLTRLSTHIQKRHNLVHRNGIDQNNNLQEISENDLILVIKDSNSLVEHIAEKINRKVYLPWYMSPENDELPF